MINTKWFEIPKRMIIILLMAIFSFYGIVACGGAEDIAGSKDYIETGPVDEPTDEPTEPEQPTFDESTYMKIYVPWGKTLASDQYTATISWQDTNGLNNLWKAFIESEKDNDGERWFIRDGDNRQEDVRDGNYYYFDKNLDIVHAGKYADKVRLKEFVGGVIVKYSGGRQEFTGKVWTIGGLYKTVLNKSENNSEGQKGYTKYENDNLNEFMRAIHRWEEGDLSVILMNVGYAFGNDEYGVDEYYCTVDDNYRKNPSYFIGVDPNTYLGTDLNGYWNEKLNVRVNHSWKTSEKFNFKFVSAEPYSWHLQ